MRQIKRRKIINTSGKNNIRLVQSLLAIKNQGSIPTSPLQFEIEKISISLAAQLNQLWHSRLPIITNPYLGNQIAFGAQYKNIWFASAIWTRPIARAFNHVGFLELRRLAISPEAPKNTASRMLSIMEKHIKNNFCDIWKLISYQDTEVHLGTIYKASNWQVANTSGKSNWQVGGRKANKYQAAGPKIRWERQIRSQPKITKRIKREVILIKTKENAHIFE